MPLEPLSVIVTAHNCAGLIQRTLQSAAGAIAFLRQHDANAAANAIDVVVVDDGSTDKTPHVVEDFIKGRSGWQFVRREKASSPSCARNTGVRYARGEALCFLDGDDLYLPEHLAICRRALADPAADFVKCHVLLADPVHADWRPRIEHSLVLNLAVRRRCHDVIGGFPDDHLFARKGDGFEHRCDLFFKFEDMYYNELLARLFRGVQVREETVQYCRHPGNSYDRQYAKFCRPFAEAGPPPVEDRLRLRLCEAIIQDRAERLLGERGGQTVRRDQQALRFVQQRQQVGDHAGAETACRRLLEAGPADADIWHLLGTSCAAQGKVPEAETAYREAIRLRSDHAAALFALGGLLVGKGRRAEAVACYRRGVQARPEDAEARTQLGVALAEQGELDEAAAHLRTACQHTPGFARAHYNLAVALAQLGRNDEAAVAFAEALRLQPDYAAAAYGLGNVLGAKGRHVEAVERYREALRLNPLYAEAHNNLGLALIEVGEGEEAAVVLHQGVRLRPQAAEAHNNLGLALANLGRYAEAEGCYHDALRLNPGYAEAHANLASVHKDLGRTKEALAGYQLALGLDPNSASTHWNRSLALLQAGDYERGWTEYEWRWRRKGMAPRRFAQPAWDGTPLAGRTLLVYMEQGLGDMIQFLRYGPLARRTGGRVVVECPAGLLPLFATCSGIDELVAEGTPLPPFDCHAALLSLPRLLGTTQATVPAEVPYLSAQAKRVEAWRLRLGAEAGFKVGVVWQGNPRHRGDHHRSVSLARFASLARLPGVRLVSLQRGPGSEQAAAGSQRFAVQVLEGLDADGCLFLDTAAVMQHLDLVVSVDTAVLHLAGALGVPACALLPVAADWRWLREQETNPWYPTLRLFRQTTPGDWDGVFLHVATTLREAVVERSDPKRSEPLF